ncbi:Fpg/Nei family DNA glycosylase [Streptomyces sp. NBC_01190]|uniref:Fpg/Nei family DNA glycosylase n=1 Tax=Streptomyces sp. NBC_01190 TaxID=2903767 RepID=UPI0038644B02|nr:Fpg/Nei family DNA glycosylase [Streptomyces sp. NBC_01190]
MPELPDVEGFRRVLRECGQGRVIEKVAVADAGVLRDVSARRFRAGLEGHRLSAPERHGKWLIARTDDGPALLLHFGMTGRLLCCAPREPRHRHDRVRLDLGDGHELRYRDQRKLQGLRLAGSEAEVDHLLAGQGPDALAVDRAEFCELLGRRRGRIKPVLMDQATLAGLGNLLVDEILWRARIHPAAPANRLTEAECALLHSGMRRVLSLSVRAGRVPGRPSWLTGHREEPSAKCPRCGTPLRRGKVDGRTTVWCPHDQPERAGR